MTPDPNQPARELARLVQQMRAAQAAYFRGCRGPDREKLLSESKTVERKVDEACKAILNPPTTVRPSLPGMEE